MQQDSSQWELDSDEIASITSEDLHDNRPNRWTGPKSSWRAITEEERLLWQSMKQLRDQDLAAHLYNAFALKKRGKDSKLAQDLTVKTDDGQDAVWAPPKSWTAWPLRERHLPDEGLIKKQDDEDEPFTFRNEQKRMPSSELHDELGAMILRIAKERFHKREKTLHASVEPEASLETGSPAPSSPDISVKAEGIENSEKASVDGDDLTPKRQTEDVYEPMVSTNDELSYKLLEPSVRHILSLMDKTLTVLHHSRAAGLGYVSDSTSDDDSDTQSQQKRARGRPRRTSQPGDETSSPGPSTAPSARKGGRPRKVQIPREGESHEDMLLRVAREGHRRLPPVQANKDAAFEEWLRRGEERVERARSMSRKRQESEARMTEEDLGTSNAERKLARWGLRNWGDVVGAAALAGFSDDVIARTTKRCANLFGEGMVVRRLHEVPAPRGSGVQSVEYRPEQILLSDSQNDSDSSADAAATLSQRRIASRQASLARSSHDSGSDTPRGRHATPSKSPSQSRSGSRSLSRSSMAQFFCPVASCERAANGFARKPNLVRHMNLVHQGQQHEDVDTDDEVVGAVHVDGFLKTIVPSRGWRGEDAVTRKRKTHWGRRQIGPGSQSRETSPDAGDSSS